MHIVHLVDDTSAGGVTRFLDFLTAAPELPAQDILAVRRGRWSAPRINADLIVSHTALSWRMLPMLVALRARYPGTPIVHVEHHYTRQFAALKVPSQVRFAAMLRAAFSLFDHVVAVSEAQAGWLIERGLVDPSALTAIPPAVDLTAFAGIPAAAGPVRRVAALGRLDRAKGLDLPIAALARGARVALHIHGDGPDRTRLKQLAAGLAVTFHGRSDPVRAIAAADAVVVPSRHESYGLVALEARAAGRPVLVSGADGLADHVAEGAIAVGSSADDWARALAGIDALTSAVDLETARCLALASAHRCIARWQDLIHRHGGERPLEAAA